MPLRPNKYLFSVKFPYEFILIRVSKTGFEAIGQEDLTLAGIACNMFKVNEIGMMNPHKLLPFKESAEMFQVF